MTDHRRFILQIKRAFSDYYGMQLIHVDELFREYGIEELIELNYDTFRKADRYLVMEQIGRYIQTEREGRSDLLY